MTGRGDKRVYKGTLPDKWAMQTTLCLLSAISTRCRIADLCQDNLLGSQHTVCHDQGSGAAAQYVTALTLDGRSGKYAVSLLGRCAIKLVLLPAPRGLSASLVQGQCAVFGAYTS